LKYIGHNYLFFATFLASIQNLTQKGWINLANNSMANQNVLGSKGTSDFNPVDFFNSYNKRPYSYYDTYIIAGNSVERRKYSEPIYCNYKSEFPGSKKRTKKRKVKRTGANLKNNKTKPVLKSEYRLLFIFRKFDSGSGQTLGIIFLDKFDQLFPQINSEFPGCW